MLSMLTYDHVGILTCMFKPMFASMFTGMKGMKNVYMNDFMICM